MKTIPSAFVTVLAVIAMAGCSTPFRAPTDVAQITLVRTDSPVVRVDKIWVERKAGLLVVRGLILKRLDATDTTQTHLDVILYDATDRILRSTVEHFEPRQILRGYRQPDDATYGVVLDPLPAGTVRIEVRAHEGNHS